MSATWTSPRFPFRRPLELDRGLSHHRVAIVGAGMVGLTVALDLARHGIATVLLDEDDTVSIGSRAICLAKRTLEIYDRLGLGQRLLDKGVTWQVGKVFHGTRLAYAFDLLPETGHRMPAFINLQQYYLEAWLVEACAATGLVDLRWRSRVAALERGEDHVRLTVETPEGAYALTAEWVLACDGARSTVRAALGLPFVGQVFRDRFLIADVVLKGELSFPSERWFWFDPPFHPGQSVLLHKQPDRMWRIDFQLGWQADPEEEKRPERVIPRIRAMLGEEIDFDLEWVSVYTFRCRRLERFVHGRIVFLGDAAHQVSPFGARGGNGGVQDADNLAWKLAAVLRGEAPAALIDSYDAERIPAADENILHSTRSTDFITPKTEAARAYRDAVLCLARGHDFARRMVNSGRLSGPHRYAATPLSTLDREAWTAGPPPGAAAVDAPIPDGWLLNRLGGRPVLLLFGAAPDPALPGLAALRLPVEGVAAERYGARDGAAYLIRPDQHVAARFAAPAPEALGEALARMWAQRPAALRSAA
ncbi:FAD-dependent oxidoreductase [Elioraea sp. Yellowstone]|jgi:3-(3-hydroxy-phenyl)propionate hydroxylase|uniref:FAD-dependent oxidoreductase n=1 Tax=Elioraea sp. Yellowstone TaxID=2592070 RepID=UPI001150131C|nr:FAD-dependent oxidoreductase [Elioraea sp. Yellowstone]TQF84806.1 FAD-dependent oxidoreductase [Elioraea sp. Yellowstone]